MIKKIGGEGEAPHPSTPKWPAAVRSKAVVLLLLIH